MKLNNSITGTLRHFTLVDLLPMPKGIALPIQNATLVLLSSVVVGLSAQMEVRLPFTPVPITGQTLAILLVGMALGWKRAALAMLAYLAEGAAGLPVFSGGASGLHHLVGPTCGYLFSFPIAAGCAGWFAERGWDRNGSTTFAAMLLSSIPNLTLGAFVLSFYVGGLGHAIQLGVIPFLIGDLLKAALAAIALPLAWKVVGSRGLRN